MSGKKIKKKKVLDNKDLKSSDENIVVKKKDDEPSWYHYVVVLIVFFGIFAGIYYGFEYFGKSNDTSKYLTQTFDYPYKVGNVTYNIKFNYPIEILNSKNFKIEPNKLDVLNTINYTQVFYDYNSTDNGKVAISAIKVRNFLKYVYHVSFNNVSKIDKTSCLNSSKNAKIMIFDLTSNNTSVFYNVSNGCTIFSANSAENMVILGDKFIYSLIKQ